MKLNGLYVPDPPRRPSGLRVVLILLALAVAALPLVYGAVLLAVELTG